MSERNLSAAGKKCGQISSQILAAAYTADSKLKPILEELFEEAKDMCEYYSKAAAEAIEGETKYIEQQTKNIIWDRVLRGEVVELNEAAKMELSPKLAGFYRRTINRIIEDLAKLGVKESDLFSEPKTILPKPQENPMKKELGESYFDHIKHDVLGKKGE